MCTHLYYSSWARPCQPTSACMSACPLQHGAGGRVQRPSNQPWTKPISRHPRASRTTTATSPGASREPLEMPRNPAPDRALARADSCVGFRGSSRGSLEAPGLVAVVVRDALGCLLMGLVHDWLLGRCTLPPAPCCTAHANVGWHSLAQLERIKTCTHLQPYPSN